MAPKRFARDGRRSTDEDAEEKICRLSACSAVEELELREGARAD
jgi:hypothetical protein